MSFKARKIRSSKRGLPGMDRNARHLGISEIFSALLEKVTAACRAAPIPATRLSPPKLIQTVSHSVIHRMATEGGILPEGPLWQSWNQPVGLL